MNNRQIEQALLYLATNINNAQHRACEGDLRSCGDYVADLATSAGRLLRTISEARAADDAARNAELAKGGKYGA